MNKKDAKQRSQIIQQLFKIGKEVAEYSGHPFDQERADEYKSIVLVHIDHAIAERMREQMIAQLDMDLPSLVALKDEISRSSVTVKKRADGWTKKKASKRKPRQPVKSVRKKSKSSRSSTTETKGH